MSISYGIYGVISTQLPTDEDRRQTELLTELLVAFDAFEPKEDAERRELALGKLNELVSKWAQGVAERKRIPDAADAGARIFTFGSYRLGVHGKGADIDTVCVVPRYVDRDADFFATLVPILRAQKEIQYLNPVPDAFVPVIKMIFDSVEIDLLCACLNLDKIPPNLEIRDDNLLKSIDDKSIRSLNGSRDIASILKLVPDVDNFRGALRFVKIWAKRRGIYGNAFGYLGGVSWAILAAYIAQLYPNALPSTLMVGFFRVLSKWKWTGPIMLTEIQHKPELGRRQWNPHNPEDQRQHMKVITPAYPCMNSTHNVSRSSLDILKKEFERGFQVCTQLEEKKCSWFDLIACPPFFKAYRIYVQVLITTDTELKMQKWKGFMESKLRILVLELERVPRVENVHLWPESFPLEPDSDIKFGRYYYVGLVLAKSESASVDITVAVSNFNRRIFSWTAIEDRMELEVVGLQRKFLPAHVVSLYNDKCALPPASIPVLRAQKARIASERERLLLNRGTGGAASAAPDQEIEKIEQRVEHELAKVKPLSEAELRSQPATFYEDDAPPDEESERAAQTSAAAAAAGSVNGSSDAGAGAGAGGAVVVVDVTGAGNVGDSGAADASSNGTLVVSAGGEAGDGSGGSGVVVASDAAPAPVPAPAPAPAQPPAGGAAAAKRSAPAKAAATKKIKVSLE